jgi:hypothetical protein
MARTAFIPDYAIEIYQGLKNPDETRSWNNFNTWAFSLLSCLRNPARRSLFLKAEMVQRRNQAKDLLKRAERRDGFIRLDHAGRSKRLLHNLDLFLELGIRLP